MAFANSGASYEFVFLQMAFATVTMAIYALAIKHYKFKLESGDIKDYVVLGVLASGIGQLFAMTGLSFTTISNYSLIRALIPTVAIFFSVLLYKTKFSGKFLLITATMITGAVVFITKLDPKSLSAGGLGDLLVFGNVIILGFTNVYAKTAMSNKKPEIVSLGRFLFALPLLLAVVVLFGKLEMPGNIWLTVLSGVSFGIGNMLFYKGIGLTDSATASNFNLTGPIYGLIFGALFFAETYAPIQYLGAGIIIAGGVAMAKMHLEQK